MRVRRREAPHYSGGPSGGAVKNHDAGETANLDNSKIKSGVKTSPPETALFTEDRQREPTTLLRPARIAAGLAQLGFHVVQLLL